VDLPPHMNLALAMTVMAVALSLVSALTTWTYRARRLRCLKTKNTVPPNANRLFGRCKEPVAQTQRREFFRIPVSNKILLDLGSSGRSRTAPTGNVAEAKLINISGGGARLVLATPLSECTVIARFVLNNRFFSGMRARVLSSEQVSQNQWHLRLQWNIPIESRERLIREITVLQRQNRRYGVKASHTALALSACLAFGSLLVSCVPLQRQSSATDGGWDGEVEHTVVSDIRMAHAQQVALRVTSQPSDAVQHHRLPLPPGRATPCQH